MALIRGKAGVTVGVAAALTLALAAGAAAAERPVCQDYKAKNRIMRIGQHPFAKKAPVKNVAELQAMWTAQGDEIKSLLESQGLGQTAAPLAEAVAAGKVRDAELKSGDTLNWMAYRKRAKKPADLIMPACYAGKKTYPGYAMTVEIPQAVQIANAICRLDASGDVAAKTLKADASASSKGATVVMKGPGGEQTIISPDGPRTWEGPWVKRYCFDTEFVVNAPPPVTDRKIDVYDFMVPAACGNLSFAGQTIRTEQVKGEACTATFSVPRAVPPPPSITLAVEPAEIFRGQSVTYTATGHWDREAECGVVDPLVVTTARCSDPEAGRWTAETGSFTPAKAGSYTFSGTAKNEIGDATSTTTTVLVKPRWAIRGFLAAIKANSNSAWQRTNAGTTSEELSSLTVDDGWGIGASAEYRFSDLMGLEGALIFGELESKFRYSRFAGSDSDSDKMGMKALTFGPNFHLIRGSKADFYVGPFAAYMQMDDASFNVLGANRKRGYSNELGYGAQLGLDYGFGPCTPWALHFGLRYIDPKFDVDGGDGNPSITVTPLLFEAGFAYRF